MTILHRRGVRAAACAAALVACALTGCGRSGGTAQAADEQPQDDPRFATADALLAEYNRCTGKSAPDLGAICDLFYSETEAQGRYIRLIRSMQPLMELDHLMWDRFHERWNPGSKRPMSSPDPPAAVTKRADRRVEASGRDSEGITRTVYLVQIGDRWWVSGYTLEYQPEFQRRSKANEMEMAEQFNSMLTPYIPQVSAAIKDGRIQSPMLARAAVVQLAMKDHPELRDLIQRMMKEP